MNFYDVLAAEKWSGGIPTINFFDLLFAQSLGGGEQWETYEGTLPAALNANGDDMRQYQVYGAAGGVGDRTVNIYNGTIKQGYYSFSTGDFTPRADLLNKWVCTDIIPCEQNTTYGVMTQLVESLQSRSYGFVWFDENLKFLRSSNQQTLSNPVRYAANSQDAAYMALNFSGTLSSTNIYPSSIKNITVTIGTTPPETHVPYGYEVDIGVSDGTTSTTTPIYIGDEPLEKDEYVDYQTQKVYRMIDGTLTPTDPPVPLPALPTVEGTTIIDYTGSGTAPEKVYFEYQGGKQP